MCVSPGTNRQGQQFACRECTQCRDHYIDDWAGRCIAESKTAKAWHVLTLTYGNERFVDGRDMAIDQKQQAAKLAYSDVQNYFKRVRAAGYPFRFFCVGEYGSERGRAHWHIIMFWLGEVPPHKIRENFCDDLWPHGLQYWDDGKQRFSNCPAGERAANVVRYTCKYLDKDLSPQQARKEGLLAMSKMPALGHDYFDGLAQRYVDQQIAIPNPFIYHFADCLGLESRKPIRFHLTRASLDGFLKMYVAKWRKTYGHDMWPYSETVNKYLDSLVPELGPRPQVYRPGEKKPWFFPPMSFPGDKLDTGFYLDEKVNTYYCIRDGRRLWWSWDDEGRRAWRDEAEGIRVVRQADKRLSMYPQGYAAKRIAEISADYGKRHGLPPFKGTR